MVRDIGNIRKELLERRIELTAELDRLTQPPEEGASVGFGKRVGDGTTEAVERLASSATARSLYSSIEDIDKAIDRLEHGGYGICDNCHEEIPPARMQALPAATKCVGCASFN